MTRGMSKEPPAALFVRHARASPKHWLRAAARAGLCAAMLAAGGCMHAARAIVVRHYDLGAVSTPAAAGRHAVPGRGKVLQLSGISVPEWLSGTAMYYRLDYRDDRRLAAYAHSDWIATPATLLEPVIRNAIVAGGGWRAVLGPRDPADADATLQLRLDDFSQAFPRSGDSAGVVDATATLVANRSGSVLAQRHFHVESAAPTADARGGVEALDAASRRLAAQLQSWLKTAAAAPG